VGKRPAHGSAVRGQPGWIATECGNASFRIVADTSDPTAKKLTVSSGHGRCQRASLEDYVLSGGDVRPIVKYQQRLGAKYVPYSAVTNPDQTVTNKLAGTSFRMSVAEFGTIRTMHRLAEYQWNVRSAFMGRLYSARVLNSANDEEAESNGAKWAVQFRVNLPSGLDTGSLRFFVVCILTVASLYRLRNVERLRKLQWRSLRGLSRPAGTNPRIAAFQPIPLIGRHSIRLPGPARSKHSE